MSTLEELLAEDGFDRERYKQQKLLQREGSAASIAASFPDPQHGFSGSKPCPARTRSDVNPRRSLPMVPEKCGYTDPKSGNALARRFSAVSFYKERPPELQVGDGRVLRYSKEPKDSEGSSIKNRWRFFSLEAAGVNCNSRRAAESKDGCSEDLLRKLGYNWSYKNELYEHEERKGRRTQNLFKPSFKDDRVRFPEPALGETTLKEVLLKINSCVTDLLEDESFRLSVNHSVFPLNSSEMKDTQPSINGVLSTLKEAIEAVESMITDGFTKLELKKISRKLSVITNLESKESEEKNYCGISLSHLVACAHLYLSILYKIQKKDVASAKHLLQVFFHSPYQARTALLPELWESLFLPHLSHLKQWRDREAESLQGASGTKRKLEFVKKLYNDLLDMGTCKFAAFYTGWLMEDYKSPALTSVLMPSASFPTIPEEYYGIVSTKFSRSSYSVPSKAMISKMPYESQSKRNQNTDEMESGWKQEAEQTEVLRQYQETMKEDEETGNQSPCWGSYSLGSLDEYYSAN